ncbi:MAG: PH domain-containing protein [Pseudomonadota bacterium]
MSSSEATLASGAPARKLAEAEQQDDRDAPQRTAPLSIGLGVLSAAQNAVIPVLLVGLGNRGEGFAVLASLALGAVFVLIGLGFSFLRWQRLTYSIGAQDIRVESGILSRSARSVPYERIQDVSLEQSFLPRLLGLVAVKFETGAGGGDDLSLTYLTLEQGEGLRQMVRERRDAANAEERVQLGASALESADSDAETLFTMGPQRLFVFGLFEFSLAVFAVLAGLLQYLDDLIDIDLWEVEFWEDLAREQGGWLLELGAYAQALGAIAGLTGVFVLGSATGIVRTFNREWGFLLERTARGFRRRRGLFTRTDVVMPVHRVQGVRVGTGMLRYRFGWHSLRFVSLAQDAGSASHVVAPFARMEELAPIVAAAGFQLPDDDTAWHRATIAYRTDGMVLDGLFFVLAALIAGVGTAIYAPDWVLIATAIPLALALLAAGLNWLSWQHKRHALGTDQIMAQAGVLAPRSQLASRLKLHSAEITQGPLARLRGYATLHLGLAGGVLAIPGIPLARARQVRSQVLETITATDFSQLETA